MGDTFKFSLYEVFGYICPGFVLGSAAVIVDWSTVHSGAQTIPGCATSKSGVALMIGVSYVLGHAVQAMANIIMRGSTKRIINSCDGAGCHELLKRARKHAPERFDGLPNETLVCIFEQAFQNRGPSPEREVFVYREGFYRGMLIAMSALALSLVVLTVKAPTIVLFHRAGLARRETVTASLFAAVMAVGMFRRALRFAKYRILQAITSWLLTYDLPEAGKDTKSVTNP